MAHSSTDTLHQQRAAYAAWYRRNPVLHPLLGKAWSSFARVALDLSRAGGQISNGHDLDRADQFTVEVAQKLQQNGAQVGYGGYGEERAFYVTPAYAEKGPHATRWRNTHLGLDLWMDAGTELYAPLAGIVHSLADNAAERDYGPTLVLEHRPQPGLTFYTLYGHLDRAVLDFWQAGEPVPAGTAIARIGAPPANGNWPPHLHWQVMLDMQGRRGDFPGVCFADERDYWLTLCPDPQNLLV